MKIKKMLKLFGLSCLATTAFVGCAGVHHPINLELPPATKGYYAKKIQTALPGNNRIERLGYFGENTGVSIIIARNHDDSRKSCLKLVHSLSRDPSYPDIRDLYLRVNDVECNTTRTDLLSGKDPALSTYTSYGYGITESTSADGRGHLKVENFGTYRVTSFTTSNADPVQKPQKRASKVDR